LKGIIFQTESEEDFEIPFRCREGNCADVPHLLEILEIKRQLREDIKLIASKSLSRESVDFL
jgi:hypothetical protein